MSRKALPGLSRERVRVFAQVVEATVPSPILVAVLEYIIGERGPSALANEFPALHAAVISAEAGTAER